MGYTYNYPKENDNWDTHFMSTFNFPAVFVPSVGLVCPAIAMASFSHHVQKGKIV